MKTYIEVEFQDTGIEVTGYEASEESPDIIRREDRKIRIWGIHGIVEYADAGCDFEAFEARIIGLYSRVCQVYRLVKGAQTLRDACYEIFYADIGAVVGVVTEKYSDFSCAASRLGWRIEDISIVRGQDNIYWHVIRDERDRSVEIIVIEIGNSREYKKLWRSLNLK